MTDKPKRGPGRPPKDLHAPRRGRQPKATYAVLLAQLRTERERLADKVTALGTAIEALEAAEA